MNPTSSTGPGEVVLELDNGVERTLRAGNVNIHNGTRRRWHNRGTEPATDVRRHGRR
jgi:hypothetical protein